MALEERELIFSKPFLCCFFSLPCSKHLRPHAHSHIRAPLGTRASQSAYLLRQEQALLYDEEQLLFLACSQVAVGSLLCPH